MSSSTHDIEAPERSALRLLDAGIRATLQAFQREYPAIFEIPHPENLRGMRQLDVRRLIQQVQRLRATAQRYQAEQDENQAENFEYESDSIF